MSNFKQTENGEIINTKQTFEEMENNWMNSVHGTELNYAPHNIGVGNQTQD